MWACAFSMVLIVWDLTTENRELLHVYNVQLNV